ncbi:MAG: 3-dehydroquinate synthase [Ruminococcaceae bacterium]|jgi:3-dehydroquinate synthase|nr:3-dehydroquinate synthase [Oscillospiraceae bacterium]
MRTIQVNASRSYEIHIGAGLLPEAGEKIRPFCPGGLCAVVTDDIVDGLYADRLEQSLASADLRVVKFVFSHGEQGKNAENYLSLLNFLAESGLTRADCVVALGGGVPGDLAGFAAATYLRGVGFVQIPTTLLAAVDSSVGGKTAIDLPAGKNLAGAFYQPDLVLCDTDTLATLPDKQFRAGCAEVIKYAMLFDAEMFSDLMVSGPAFRPESVIARCVEFKREIVTADEFDRGCRQLLNLGHTVGHAVEKLSGFTVLHGQAVAIGMSVIARACAENDLCSPDCSRALDDILIRFGLPVACPYGADALAAAMTADKKRHGDAITLVVPRDVGECVLYELAADELGDFIKAGLK